MNKYTAYMYIQAILLFIWFLTWPNVSSNIYWNFILYIVKYIYSALFVWLIDFTSQSVFMGLKPLKSESFVVLCRQFWLAAIIFADQQITEFKVREIQLFFYLYSFLAKKKQKKQGTNQRTAQMLRPPITTCSGGCRSEKVDLSKSENLKPGNDF